MYIVADIGGTKTRIAKSADLENIEEPVVIETPKQYEEGIATVIRIVKEIAGDEKIDAVALDIAGLISPDGEIPVAAPHLPDWKGRPLGRELEAALSTRVHVLNDTAQVGLGEAIYGAGKGANIVVYVTVSTGATGVRIVDGK